MKSGLFSVNSFKVWGEKPYNEGKKSNQPNQPTKQENLLSVAVKSTDAAIWRCREPGAIRYWFGPVFGEISVTDDCATGMFEGLGFSGKML